MASVLLVSADRAQSTQIVDELSRDYLGVRVSDSGSDAVAAIHEDRFDLVILSFELPDGPVIDVCREVRRHSPVPILMVSQDRSENDLVLAFAAGADAFAVTPSLRELLARCRALLRRCPPSDRRPESTKLEVGDLVMDLERHEVLVRGKEVALALKEFQLLATLLANAGRVVSRDTLIAHVWGPDYFGDTKTLDVHIRRIRSKIESSGGPPQSITTIRGVGYRYEKDRAVLARAS